MSFLQCIVSLFMKFGRNPDGFLRGPEVHLTVPRASRGWELTRLQGLQEFWKKDAFPKTSRCSSCNGLLPYDRLILNTKPRSDQNILESLKNVLTEGIGESEDLLITVSLEGKISSLVWQFPPVQFEWNPVRDICLKQSFINHSPRVVFWGECNMKLQHTLRNCTANVNIVAAWKQSFASKRGHWPLTFVSRLS